MAGFDFWQYTDEDTYNRYRAEDFGDQARQRTQQADGDMFGNAVGGILSGFHAALSRAGQGLQDAADFGSRALDTLRENRAHIPGYFEAAQQQDAPAPRATAPEASQSPVAPISDASATPTPGSGSPLLDAWNAAQAEASKPPPANDAGISYGGDYTALGGGSEDVAAVSRARLADKLTANLAHPGPDARLGGGTVTTPVSAPPAEGPAATGDLLPGGTPTEAEPGRSPLLDAWNAAQGAVGNAAGRFGSAVSAATQITPEQQQGADQARQQIADSDAPDWIKTTVQGLTDADVLAMRAKGTLTGGVQQALTQVGAAGLERLPLVGGALGTKVLEGTPLETTPAEAIAGLGVAMTPLGQTWGGPVGRVGGPLGAAEGAATAPVAGALEATGGRVAETARGAVGDVAGKVGDLFKREGEAVPGVAQGVVGEQRVVPPDVVRALPVQTRLETIEPETLDALREASHEIGGNVTPEGVELDLRRYQKPNLPGEDALRGGVFYETGALGGESQYRTLPEGQYGAAPSTGGSQEVAGPTLFKNPLVTWSGESGATGIDNALAAVGAPDGQEGVWRAVKNTYFAGSGREADLAKVLAERGGDASVAGQILARVPEDEIKYTVVENIIANRARQQGYDGWIKLKDRENPIIFEIMDFREGAYPHPGGAPLLTKLPRGYSERAAEVGELPPGYSIRRGGLDPFTRQPTYQLIKSDGSTASPLMASPERALEASGLGGRHRISNPSGGIIASGSTPDAAQSAALDHLNALGYQELPEGYSVERVGQQYAAFAPNDVAFASNPTYEETMAAAARQLREGGELPSAQGGFTLRPEFMPQVESGGAPGIAESGVVGRAPGAFASPEEVSRLQGTLANTPASRMDAARRAAGGQLLQSAVGGGVSGGYEASQDEDVTPESVTGAAALGVAGAVGRRALARTVTKPGALAGMARVTQQTYGPTDEKVAASIAEPPTGPTVAGMLQRLPNEIVKKWFDVGVSLHEATDLVEKGIGRKLDPDAKENAYVLWRLSKGSDAAAAQLYDKGVGPAVEGLDREKFDALNRIMRAQDGIDRGAATGNPNRDFGGFTAVEAPQALAELKAGLGQQTFDDLTRRADAIYGGLRKDLLGLMVDSGRLTQQQADDLVTKFPHYSPTKIVDWMVDHEGDGAGTSPSTLSVGGADWIKKLTDEGTARETEAPLAAYELATHEIRRLADKNLAARALIQDMLKVPELADQIRPANEAGRLAVGRVVPSSLGSRKPGEVAFTAWGNGERHEFWINKSVDDAFTFAPPNPSNNLMTKVLLAIPAAIERAGATGMNALFMIHNSTGDAMDSLVRNGGDLPRTVAGLADSYGNVFSRKGFEGDPWNERRIAAGGGISGRWYRRAGEPGQRAEELAHLSTEKDLWDWVKTVAGAPFAPVRAFGERVETATRRAQFKQSVESGGMGEKAAALSSRDVTLDFDRGGEWAKTINTMVPFFNAQLQGMAQAPRLLRNPATRKSAAIGLMTTVVLPTVASEVYNRNDPTYRDVPQYDKDRGLIIMDPRGPGPVDPETGRPTPRYAVINMRVATPLAIGVREGIDRAMGDEPRTWQELAKAMFKSVSPVDVGPNAAFSVAPPLLRMGAELASNYDAFRDRAIVPDSLKHLPPGQQYDERTTETAKRLGQLTGASPLQIEHLASLGGGVAKQVLGAGDLALKAAGVTPEPGRRVAQLQTELAKTGLPADRRDTLQHELEALQAREQARAGMLREQPVVGGLASTIYREQGGEIQRREGQQADQRLEQLRQGQSATGAELNRLGVAFPDVGMRIGDRALNRRDAAAYRTSAMDLREQLLDQLVAQPSYQAADDVQKTRMLKAADARAAAWAGQAVMPRPDEAGAEFLTQRIGQDPGRAIDGYLGALDTQAQLDELRARRFPGRSPDEVDRITRDAAVLRGLSQSLGSEGAARSAFLRDYGSERLMDALRAGRRDSSTLQARRLRADPNYALFFETGPKVQVERRASAPDLEGALAG